MSLRKSTFFEKSHQCLLDITGFVNLWVMSCTFPVIQLQLRMANQTIVDWSSFCREVVYDAMVVRKVKLGGYGHTIEIDESKFGKRKHHRGHRVEGQWVHHIGLLEGTYFLIKCLTFKLTQIILGK